MNLKLYLINIKYKCHSFIRVSVTVWYRCYYAVAVVADNFGSDIFSHDTPTKWGAVASLSVISINLVKGYFVQKI